MSRLRTLFVIDELDIGGTEQQILETVRRIDRDRFEPYVCCFRHGAKAREIESPRRPGAARAQATEG